MMLLMLMLMLMLMLLTWVEAAHREGSCSNPRLCAV
jgi:hypothetical protein